MDLAADIGGARSQAFYELLRQRLVKQPQVVVPAAGADWSVTVPAGAVWELLQAHDTFVTSAVVANRIQILRATDADGNEQLRSGPQGVQPASVTNTYDWLAGFGDHNGAGRQQMSLPTPPYLLRSGWVLGSLTSSMDVADQYSGIFVTVREWTTREVLAACDWLADHTR